MSSPSAANVSVVTGLSRLFYIVQPSESMYEHVKDVPDYVIESTPSFALLVLLEFFVLWLQGKPLPRLDDSLSSVSAGYFSQFTNVFVRAIELITYIWVWENYRVYELPWESVWTWVFTAIAVDFAYYWVHRFGHEVNFMWAAHQVHHSSEDYTLSTALRQSVLQNYSSWIFYLPIALVVPPSVFLVHKQLNLLYQFWIHTETIGWLGPLEYIINTPSAHRVHHGRNRYCIDKNYGGTLIIFDIMFGTYASEKFDSVEDKVVYGLVHPLETRNPIMIQLCHWQWIINCMIEREGFINKIKTLVYGPGWEPGKPRMGLITDIPDIHYPQPKYSTKASTWVLLYTIVHFTIIMFQMQITAEAKLAWNTESLALSLGYVMWTFISIGALFDQRSFSSLCELVRCNVAVFYIIRNMESLVSVFGTTVTFSVLAVYSASAVVWVIIANKRRKLQ